MLIAAMLDPQVLQRLGIMRVTATVTVGADHVAKQFEIDAGANGFAEDVATALAAALGQAVFVAAVDHGRFVEGTFVYDWRV